MLDALQVFEGYFALGFVQLVKIGIWILRYNLIFKQNLISKNFLGDFG